MKSVIKMMRKKMQNGSRGKYQDTEGKLCQSKYIYIFFFPPDNIDTLTLL